MKNVVWNNVENVENAYVELIDSIKRMATNEKSSLINYLRTKDFFKAPLTSENFYAFEGGLALFGLHLYKLMLHTTKYLMLKYDEESIKILALFSTLGKIDYYQKQYKNVKIYSDKGNLVDNNGKYYWDSEQSYGVRPAKDRNVLGSLGLNSYMILSGFMPLLDAEIVALINFNCGYVKEDNKDTIELNKRYTLLALLQNVSRMLLYLPINIDSIPIDTEESVIELPVEDNDVPF